MPVDVVLRQAVQLGGVAKLDGLLAVGDVAVEHRLRLGELIVQLAEFRPHAVALVDTREAELQHLPLDVVTRGSVGAVQRQRGERLVHRAVERDGAGGVADLPGHGGRVVAECGIGMHLFHQAGEVLGRVQLPDGLVVRDKRVLNGSGAVDGGDRERRRRSADGLPAACGDRCRG